MDGNPFIKLFVVRGAKIEEEKTRTPIQCKQTTQRKGKIVATVTIANGSFVVYEAKIIIIIIILSDIHSFIHSFVKQTEKPG